MNPLSAAAATAKPMSGLQRMTVPNRPLLMCIMANASSAATVFLKALLRAAVG